MNESIEYDDIYEKHIDKLNYDKQEVFDFMSNHDLNACDKCGIILKTYDDGLIWIEEEKNMPKWLLKEYVALCEYCYEILIEYKNKKEFVAGEI